METVGWMSVDLEKSKGNSDPLGVSRRYLDTNNVTYAVSHPPSSFKIRKTDVINSSIPVYQLNSLPHLLEEK